MGFHWGTNLINLRLFGYPFFEGANASEILRLNRKFTSEFDAINTVKQELKDPISKISKDGISLIWEFWNYSALSFEFTPTIVGIWSKKENFSSSGNSSSIFQPIIYCKLSVRKSYLVSPKIFVVQWIWHQEVLENRGLIQLTKVSWVGLVRSQVLAEMVWEIDLLKKIHCIWIWENLSSMEKLWRSPMDLTMIPFSFIELIVTQVLH